MTDKHNRYIEELNIIAADLEGIRSSRHAAFVVWKNRIYAVGVNGYKSHPVMAQYQVKHEDQIYLHAEIDAMIKAQKRLNQDQMQKATVYVSRVVYPKPFSKLAIQKNSKPCEVCMNYMLDMGIKKVIYSIDGEGYEILLRE